MKKITIKLWLLFLMINLSTYAQNTGLRTVEKGELKGFTNTNGELVIPYMYDATYGFDEKYRVAGVQIYEDYENKTGYIDENNKIIIPLKYAYVSKVNDHGVIIVKNFDRAYGAYDTEGNLLLECKYDNIINITQTEAEVKLDGVIQTIKIEKIITNEPVQQLNPIYLKNALNYNLFQENGKWGYKGDNGEVYIKPIYDKAFDFETSFGVQYAVVELDWDHGIINKLNEEIVPIKFNETLYVDDVGNVMVWNKYGKGLYNIKNGVIVPPIFDYFSMLTNGYYYKVGIDHNNNTKYGVLDFDGNIVLPIVMDYCDIGSDRDYISFTIEDERSDHYSHDGKAYKTNGQASISKIEIVTYNPSTGKNETSYDLYDNIRYENNLVIIFNDSYYQPIVYYGTTSLSFDEDEGKKLFVKEDETFKINVIDVYDSLGKKSFIIKIDQIGTIFKVTDFVSK